jgi:hypothetical protein
MKTSEAPIKTINEFCERFGIMKGHLDKHGVSYHASLKYGDTHISELPVKFREPFIRILKAHKVKYDSKKVVTK